MPIRNVSACLLLVLGLWAARNTVAPTPSAKELARGGNARLLASSVYQTSEMICEVDSADVCESSGLVRCASDPDLLWTHNDSGGAAAIVAFDRLGKIHGVVKIAGAVNRDWEEMTAFRYQGAPWLILADCGNNLLHDRLVTLYFVREPSPSAAEAACDYQVDVQFEGGPRNCEAVAVDERDRKIFFVSKVTSGRCEVFEMPLPEIPVNKLEGNSEKAPFVAKKIAAPEIMLATGMCISADGERMVIVNYNDGFEYCRSQGESWQAAFARSPKKINLSWRMPQREAVCFDRDDRSLLMTSEARQGFVNSLLGGNLNCTIPLWRVPAKPVGKKNR